MHHIVYSLVQGIKPGPADYHQAVHSESKPLFKPFGSAASRLPADKCGIGKVGPGLYKHDVPVNRHVEYNSSFGGKRTLRGIVTLKCTKGIPDKVSREITRSKMFIFSYDWSDQK